MTASPAFPEDPPNGYNGLFVELPTIICMRHACYNETIPAGYLHVPLDDISAMLPGNSHMTGHYELADDSLIIAYGCRRSFHPHKVIDRPQISTIDTNVVSIFMNKYDH